MFDEVSKKRLGMKSLKFSAVFALTCAMVAMAATQGGKVRSVLGDVSYQKQGKNNWAALRVGAKVLDGYMIRTYTESGAQISLLDGSMIAIGENALVEFNELLFDKDSRVSDISIKKGMIRFDAQKQKGNSVFKFMTGTATASIRGTDGTLGMTEAGQPYGALNSGEMVMENNGQEIPVKANQFVAFRKDKPAVVVEAKNASDPEFVKKLGEVLDDTTKSDEAIQAQAQELDQKIEVRNEDLKSKYNCIIDSLPALVSADSIDIGVTCTAGVRVSLGSESFESKGHKLHFTPSWIRGSFGDKKYLLNCSVDGADFECGRIAFTYRVDRTVRLLESDEGKCFAVFATSGFNDNSGSVFVFLGDSLIQKTNMEKDGSSTFTLVPGDHVYKVVAENVDSATTAAGTVEQMLKCYPVTNVQIDIRGGNREIVKRKVSQGAAIYPELEFDLLDVAGNDVAQVEEVIVSVDGENFEAEQVASTVGIGYKVKMRIPRGKSKIVKVAVLMRSGETAYASKIYEFK